jgi:subtilisin family serine protease
VTRNRIVGAATLATAAVALSLTAMASPAAAAPDPTPAPMARGGERTVPGQYIVVLKASAAGATARSAVGAAAEQRGGTVVARYSRVLNGFAARLPAAALAAVRADPAVAYVEPDSVIEGATDQTNPPSWGLDRIDQRTLPLNNLYRYDSTGVGATVFVVDSGIRATHTDFGGRAVGVFDAVGDGNGTNDCHGHGTHVAGTVGGAAHGVAKGVALRAVRVLQCDNSGFSSDLIEGLDFIAANHPARSVANLSLQGYGTSADVATEALIDSGVQTVFAAGNFNDDACLNGPRSVRGIVVGASDIDDTRAGFSNFGTCVDVFAPGVGITSAGIASNTATAVFSGTSMATPHVAGWVARHLEENPTATLAQSKAALIASSTKGVLSAIGTGSPNRLLWADPANTPVDTTPPSAPGQPTAANVTSTSVQLTWPASTDNVSVAGYDVHREAGATDPVVASSTTNSVTVGGLSPATTYTFYVRARDTSDNLSTASPTVTVTTVGVGNCRVAYAVGGGGSTFTANLTVTNTGTSAINGWTLGFDFTAGQQLRSGSGQNWNATWSQSGAHVTATNLFWNATINPGASVFIGFNGTHSGSNPSPTVFTLNGLACVTA